VGELGGQRSMEKGRAGKATPSRGHGVGLKSEMDGPEVVIYYDNEPGQYCCAQEGGTLTVVGLLPPLMVERA
jgi:hypothetical protein